VIAERLWQKLLRSSVTNAPYKGGVETPFHYDTIC
jgi:hypothetical protein